MGSLKTRLANVPIKLFVGSNDYLVAPEDFKALMGYLPSTVEVVQIEDYNHLDYMWGDDVNSYVNNEVFTFLEKIEQPKTFLD